MLEDDYIPEVKIYCELAEARESLENDGMSAAECGFLDGYLMEDQNVV